MEDVASPRESPPDMPLALSVSQLARLIRDTVRANLLLSRVLVRGEVSNRQHAPGGHVFFSLKDPAAQIPCVLFREDAEALGFDLEDGMDVFVSGEVDVFPRRGVVRLVVRTATPAGVGAFWAAYQRTRRKLASEGLFDAARKRALPRFPGRIGVVTSEAGAVLHDVVTILRRRFPLARVVVAPALVQGPGAPASLRRALAAVAERVDVVILARGGGSLEDLWAFNDEDLARAVAASRVPVVSAVGHETDVTIVDFAADVRAATPSAAAEIVSPDVGGLAPQVDDGGRRLVQRIRDVIAQAAERSTRVGERLTPSGLRRGVATNRARLERLRTALASGAPREFARHGSRLDALARRLDVLSPLATLRRGYAIVERSDGRILARATDAGVGDALGIRFADGRLRVRVTAREAAR